jgi:hypothetical protein
MVKVHVSTLARTPTVTAVCDLLRRDGREFSITPVPSPHGRWLSSGLSEAIRDSCAFVHIEDIDSFWSSALAQEAELALMRKANDPKYPFVIVRIARTAPSLVWERYFRDAEVLHLDSPGWEAQLLGVLNGAMLKGSRG